jgi:hypothetical protein
LKPDSDPYRYANNDPANATDPSGLDSSQQNPAMQRERREEALIASIEVSQLRQQFPDGIRPWTNRGSIAFERVIRGTMRSLDEFEKRLNSLQEERKRRGNEEILKLIDEQIKLQKQIIVMEKKQQAIMEKQLQILVDIIGNKQLNQQEYSEKELDFLRLEKAKRELNWVPAYNRLIQIYDEIDRKR